MKYEEIEWHEVPGNPGAILLGDDDFMMPVYCEGGEKTEWGVYYDSSSDVRQYGYEKYTAILSDKPLPIRAYKDKIRSEVLGYYAAKKEWSRIMVKPGKILFCQL